ncbi:hypothetical protein BaRGS_00024269, partial [Batillaria attramentaria]
MESSGPQREADAYHNRRHCNSSGEMERSHSQEFVALSSGGNLRPYVLGTE